MTETIGNNGFLNVRLPFSLIAAWLNTQQDSNGDTDTTIYWASFNGTTWTTPQKNDRIVQKNTKKTLKKTNMKEGKTKNES